jgi:uncharacterized protein
MVGAPVFLRAHHLLCILTYKGVGYTPAFTSNMTRIVEDIRHGAAIRLCSGPDSICAGLTATDRDHCHCQGVETEAMDRAAQDVLAEHLPLDSEFALTTDRLQALRAAYLAGSIRSACQECSWKPFCDDIAAAEFRDTLLLLPPSVAAR